ncbi:response regulator [Methylorubrum zatmanii]|uniref:Response regulator n=1 Tax=Methylorubrum zatmanii TaxID=29429 RepID=A0ABW1WPB0_9HYPH|nr:response regulator [Methylorubrum zatmanii]MBD8907837.1 response regulator [Methylorubrum zatmanii]
MDQPAPPPDPRHDAGSGGTSGSRPLALVVEGEATLRIEMADLLAETGFEVLEAWNAPTAIRQIERQIGRSAVIGLVIADADLPGPEGRFALARALVRRWPDLPVIALSAGPVPAPGELPPGTGFAPKPLSPALARTAWERLAG